MIGTLLPAAERRPDASAVTFVEMLDTAAATQGIGLAPAAHDVTSLPPIDTVMRRCGPCGR